MFSQSFQNLLKYFRITNHNRTNKLEPEELKHYILGTTLNYQAAENEEEIILGCGCFWGAEKGFWKLPGVITTAVGYAGGEQNQATYAKVCSGSSGHVEVVKVVWNKSIIDLSDILKMFWECHDPTQGNRQGNDSGTQYRSVIFTSNKQQEKIALISKESYQKDLSKGGYSTITTEIKSGKIFYFAEEYHQQYLAKPGSRPYCSAMPTSIALNHFKGSNFKLDKTVWDNFDWSKSHCVIRSNNDPIVI